MDAGEITQDTFVKAFQAIGQFDGKHAFAAWLFTIARRKCIDHYRATPPVSNDPMPELADTNDPAELLAVREERQDLWRLARRLLPELQFQALWFKYAEDMDVSQVARVLGKTRTHVKVLLFRARRTLADKIDGLRVGTELRPNNRAGAEIGPPPRPRSRPRPRSPAEFEDEDENEFEDEPKVRPRPADAVLTSQSSSLL